MASRRGALVVLEGCDKAGKSTHIKLLFDALHQLGERVVMMAFPVRSTTIGKLIDTYLKGETELQDEAIHLLFSANRWELSPKIEELLQSGNSVIIDRYAFSGAAFSSAKGLDLKWCKGPDVGLPQPDAVLFLNLSETDASNREDFGSERYETVEFQRKVKKSFFELLDETWKIIDTNRSIPEVHKDILSFTLQTIHSTCNEGNKPISKLWV